MRVQIRECQLDDLSAISKLSKEELGYDYPPELLKEKLERLLGDRGHRIFVAVVDGAVAGYIRANDYDVLYAPSMKNILGIAVSSSYRRTGLGRSLMDAVVSWARETDASGIRLVSGEARAGAHEFYRHYGFTCEKKQLNFHLTLK